ncbi:hypothetical protein TNCV_3654541 [Trichonephila clavipes]|nr:hypothetical protein TNCV_3654541 [Trichonephila clavipes]
MDPWTRSSSADLGDEKQQQHICQCCAENYFSYLVGRKWVECFLTTQRIRVLTNKDAKRVIIPSVCPKRPKPGHRVKDLSLVHWFRNLLTVKCERPRWRAISRADKSVSM